jgi:hypothetical protein
VQDDIKLYGGKKLAGASWLERIQATDREVIRARSVVFISTLRLFTNVTPLVLRLTSINSLHVISRVR